MPPECSTDRPPPTADVLAEMYLKQKMSMPEIAADVGLSYSTVRLKLLKHGVRLRSTGEGQIVSGNIGGHALRGRKRGPFPKEWRDNISKAKIRAADNTAKGTTLKPSGYIEITRGENKGKSVHVALMEKRIGRPLLPDECVHHIDGDRSNNDINNLALMTRSAHGRLHRREDQLSGNTRERNENGRFT